jgi:hypothetical protein
MIAAIETFILATRIRSLDQIVLLTANAEELEKLKLVSIDQRAREETVDHPFLLDENLAFVNGIPNSPRGLKVQSLEAVSNNLLLGC